MDLDAGSDVVKRIIRGKSDTELRQADFYVGQRKVTRRECELERDRRYAARQYAAKQRERGEY